MDLVTLTEEIVKSLVQDPEAEIGRASCRERV